MTAKEKEASVKKELEVYTTTLDSGCCHVAAWRVCRRGDRDIFVCSSCRWPCVAVKGETHRLVHGASRNL